MTDSAERRRPPTLRLRVTAAAESAVRAQHPWVFSDSVREQNRPGQSGELGVIFDRADRFLAIGLYDPDSPIRLRVLHSGKPVIIDPTWWKQRLRAAIDRRQGLFDERTTGYRWVHGESDGWPGLVLDRYDTTLVLKIYTAAWLPRLRDIAALIQQQLQPAQLVLRFSRNILEAARLKGLQEGCLPGEMGAETGTPAPKLPETPTVTFMETGLRFEADVVKGQKTGFFLDQRENRRRVEALARGASVLNAFSFSGGFSIYAARGGATSVTDLDISPHALAAARRNFALNHDEENVAHCRREQIQADAFAWLASNPSARFDVVILDPPSLARREAERAGAIEAYQRLAGSGMKLLREGGVLVAASCSAHVTEEEFFGAVRRATGRAHAAWQELAATGHPPDHPAGFAEARYLKCLFLRKSSNT